MVAPCKTGVDELVFGVRGSGLSWGWAGQLCSSWVDLAPRLGLADEDWLCLRCLGALSFVFRSSRVLDQAGSGTDSR